MHVILRPHVRVYDYKQYGVQAERESVCERSYACHKSCV